MTKGGKAVDKIDCFMQCLVLKNLTKCTGVKICRRLMKERSERRSPQQIEVVDKMDCHVHCFNPNVERSIRCEL